MTKLAQVVRRSLFSAILVFNLTSLMAKPLPPMANGQLPYPTGPVLKVTPGSLCDKGRNRYPAKITYCERNVKWDIKAYVMEYYDRNFGFRIQQMDRDDFKIDHLVPLCLGGGNDVSNLWPQYKEIYYITDPIEPYLCRKLARNQISQDEAVKLIIRLKTNLSEAREFVRNNQLSYYIR